MNNLKKKIVAVVTTMTLAAWMIPGSAFALTADELQAQINLLLSQLSLLQTQLSTLQTDTPTVSGCTITSFTTNLKQGDSGEAVKCLQIVLNSSADTQVAASGVGSSGSETTYFGPLTKTAVIKFQEKYASEVLATYGLTSGTGFVGSTTRAKLNTMLGTGGVVTPTTPTTPATGNAIVSLASDTPAAKQVALGAVDGIAAKFKFYGGASGVTISKLIIKRGGVSADADVSAIKLYDGITQVGSSQALNTNTHKATFSGLNWNIPAGQTKYLTVKVSIAAKGTATVGDSIAVTIESVSDVTASATLSGTFPLSGNAITIAGISVGELWVDAQGTPAAATLLSGATDQEIAAWTISASSTEGVYVHSVAITHVGSAAANDISNIKLKIAGAQIGSTVASFDSQNKATFDLSASPVSLLGGATKTIYAYCDIAAGISTARTIQFEITQYTDITAYGANSGGAIEATFDDDTAFTKQTGLSMEIGQGALTVNIDAAYNPATQNYVKGTTNRLFSAFKFTAGSREGIRVVKLKLKVNNGTGSATDISNITLWDGSTQIAGPVSLIGTYATFGSNTVGWDDPGLFDVAKSSNKTLTIRADIPTGADDTKTVDLDIAAYSDIWIDGLTSKYDITQNTTNIVLSSGNANAHDIDPYGALTLTLAADNPAGQTYIKGSVGKEMMRFNLTANSGEDITVSSITVTLNKSTGADPAQGDFTNVKLLKLDGTQLGSTSINPTASSAFSFNLTVPASGTVTLKVIADIPTTTALLSAGGYFEVAAAADITSTGVSSSATLTETVSSVTGNTMAVGEGSLTVSAASTPGDQTVIIGTTQVPVVGLVMTAGSAESVRVTYVKLDACSTQGTAQGISHTGDQDNLSSMALYDGSTRLTAFKGWDSSTATTVTFSASDFLNGQGIDITKGSQKTITVKADIPSTADADDTIALGIASASSTGGYAGNAGLTTRIVFTGLDSNTTPTTTLSYDTSSTTMSGVNLSTSTPVSGNNIYFITFAQSGTLTVDAAADTPDMAIVTVGTTGNVKEDVVFLKANLTVSRENVDITSIVIKRLGSADADIQDISLWDGTTQLGTDQALVNMGSPHSTTIISFPSGSYWRLTKDVTKTLTIKADLHGVKSADQAGATTGDTPKLCIPNDGVNYLIEGLGVGSGRGIRASSTADLCGNNLVLHKSKPTVAAASLPSTVLSAGTKTLYRWTVTAGSDGDIGWKKAIFDVSGSVTVSGASYTIGAGQSTSTIGIWMGTSTTPLQGGTGEAALNLISTSSMEIYDVATGDEVLGTTTAREWYVHNYTAGGARVGFMAATEQVIPAGTTKTYEWRGNILYGGAAGDSISVKMAKYSTATTTGAFESVMGGWSGNVNFLPVTSTAPSFLWTDRSGAGATHSAGTSDWSNDFKVTGLPTATLSLSK